MNNLHRAIMDARRMCLMWATRWAVVRPRDSDAYQVVQRFRLPYLGDRYIVIAAFAPAPGGVAEDAIAFGIGRAA